MKLNAFEPIITVLVPIIGYQKSADAAKKALAQNITMILGENPELLLRVI
jgi:fumarate hydratase class II